MASSGSPSPPEKSARKKYFQSIEQPSESETEEEVVGQSEAIFRNFCYQSYRNDSVRLEADSTPVATELLGVNDSPLA